jgi:hypothetical protein
MRIGLLGRLGRSTGFRGRSVSLMRHDELIRGVDSDTLGTGKDGARCLGI